MGTACVGDLRQESTISPVIPGDPRAVWGLGGREEVKVPRLFVPGCADSEPPKVSSWRCLGIRPTPTTHTLPRLVVGLTSSHWTLAYLHPESGVQGACWGPREGVCLPPAVNQERSLVCLWGSRVGPPACFPPTPRGECGQWAGAGR